MTATRCLSCVSAGGGECGGCPVEATRASLRTWTAPRRGDPPPWAARAAALVADTAATSPSVRGQYAHVPRREGGGAGRGGGRYTPSPRFTSCCFLWSSAGMSDESTGAAQVGFPPRNEVAAEQSARPHPQSSVAIPRRLWFYPLSRALEMSTLGRAHQESVRGPVAACPCEGETFVRMLATPPPHHPSPDPARAAETLRASFLSCPRPGRGCPMY